MVLAVLKKNQPNNDILVSSVPFVIGRSKAANFIIPHINISRSHCELLYEDSKWKIKDNSASGTYVNGLLVGKQTPGMLKAGDSVRFGSEDIDFTYVFYPVNGIINSNLLEEEFDKLTAKPVAVKKDLRSELQLYNDFRKDDGTLEKKNNIIQLSVTRKTLLIGPCNDGKVGVMGQSAITSHQLQGNSNYDAAIGECDISPNQKKQKIQLTTKRSSYELEISEVKANEQEPADLKTEEVEGIKNLILQFFGQTTNCYNFSIKTSMIPNIVAINSGRANSKDEHFKQKAENLTSTDEVLKNLKYKKKELVNEIEIQRDEQEKIFNSTKTFLKNFFDLMEAEFQCIICSELFVYTITLNCSHSFCQFCLNQWKKKEKTCPICREKILMETRSLVIDNFIEKIVEQLFPHLKQKRLILCEERRANLTRLNQEKGQKVRSSKKRKTGY